MRSVVTGLVAGEAAEGRWFGITVVGDSLVATYGAMIDDIPSRAPTGCSGKQRREVCHHFVAVPEKLTFLEVRVSKKNPLWFSID